MSPRQQQIQRRLRHLEQVQQHHQNQEVAPEEWAAMWAPALTDITLFMDAGCAVSTGRYRPRRHMQRRLDAIAEQTR